MAGNAARADGFESWAEAEVARLRAEADVLEALLARYRGLDNGPVSRPAPAGARRNAPLLAAVEDAGPGGLALEDVVEAARRAGLKATRANVRSFLWNHVRAGRLALHGDRYVTIANTGGAVDPVSADREDESAGPHATTRGQ